MSNAPYLLPKARPGIRMGHGQLVDSMIHDGLWDPYKDIHMGNCAEICAAKYAFTREAQDAFALESYHRARRANESGDFRAEIVPVEIEGKKGSDGRRPRRGALRDAPQLEKMGSSSRPSRRTAPSPPRTPRRSTTARRRSWSSPRRGGAGAGRQADRAASSPTRRRPGAGVVHDGPGPRCEKALEKAGHSASQTWTSSRSTRPSRSWPWPSSRTRARPEEGQHQRRRGGARPPDRRVRRADPGHAAPRPEGPERSAAWPRSASAAARRRPVVAL